MLFTYTIQSSKKKSSLILLPQLIIKELGSRKEKKKKKKNHFNKYLIYNVENWEPVLLPGKFHGRRSLVGCSPWGHKESDTTE